MLIAAAWLLSGNWREGLQQFIRSPVFIGWLIFYGLHILSYFYSINKEVAGFELEKKLSFAVLPLVLYGSFYHQSNRFAKLLLSFIAGVSVIALWCMARATFLFSTDGDTGHLFYHSLAKGTDANAVYLSWYVISALALLFFIPWQQYGFLKGRKWRWTAAMFLSIFLILLSSRLLLVLFVVLLILVLIRQLLSQKKRNPVITGGILFAGILTLGILSFTANPVSKRFHEVLNKNMDQSFYANYKGRDQSFNNLTLRVFLWRVGIDNLRQYQLWLFGTGTGDLDTYQDRRMDELGIERIYAQEYRSDYAGISLHNMYIQSLVALGIPGFITCCYLVWWPLGLRRRWPGKSAFLMMMAVSALFMCQESALQTQAGIVFYVFFSVILYNRYQAVKKPHY